MNRTQPCGQQRGVTAGRQIGGVQSDAVLITDSLAEPARFAAVFDRHFTLVHRFLAVRVDTGVEDLCSETFAIAFRRRASYDATRPDARAWLLGIALNLAREKRRKERRERSALARLSLPASADSTDEVVGRVDALSATARIRVALASLTDDERDVLLLHACADLSYTEIADLLAIPVGTVRSRLRRARQRARPLLLPGNIEETTVEV